MLLVPFDGSALAKTALSRAREFGSALGEDVLVLVVVPHDASFARERGWITADEPFDPQRAGDELAMTAGRSRPRARSTSRRPKRRVRSPRPRPTSVGRSVRSPTSATRRSSSSAARTPAASPRRRPASARPSPRIPTTTSTSPATPSSSGRRSGLDRTDDSHLRCELLLVDGFSRWFSR